MVISYTFNGKNLMADVAENSSVEPLRLSVDRGPDPFVVNLEDATLKNNRYRTTLWTGKNLQLTVMAIPVGGDIGLEVHTTHDQFLRIEEGDGFVQMGPAQNNLTLNQRIGADFAVFVPAGTWHNVTNTGRKPLKLYSIYAPPNHPFGTIHSTKEVAMADG